MTIRILPESVVNRIAAGEVVERPAAAVKELVENAIDAGATRIDVALEGGGQSLIAVTDNGCGMNAAEIALAVERHATSKLADEDLSHIRTLGFRGEALPSIAAVSRLTLASRPEGQAEAFAITLEAGIKTGPTPAALAPGTRVEVRDLFYATPARLKFLKTPRTESDHAADALLRLAMAHPGIAFTFSADSSKPLRFDRAAGDLWDDRLARLSAILGRDFAGNALKVQASREGYRLEGYIGLPTLNRSNAGGQYLFVDGRPVRDKLLLSAVRAAYQDLLARDRFPVLALFFEAEPGLIDVNVHPAKAEVRFRDAGLVRGLVVGGLKHALAMAGHRAATTVANAALASFEPGIHAGRYAQYPAGVPRGMYEGGAPLQAPLRGIDLAPSAIAAARPPSPGAQDYPLGAAKAQLHTTYIVAESEDGIVLVDQHAAHERLVYERLKAAIVSGSVARQSLLIPEVVELASDAAARICERAQDLSRLGLVIESFGPSAVVVREVPALILGVDVAGLLRDLADELAEHADGHSHSLEDQLLAVCASRACHNSVRAGCVLSEAEMNALLRQMEETPHSGQCGHGRPTYVELKLSDIEKLFGRR